MNSRFLDIIDPALNYVDSGSFFRQPFKWLYYIIGILNFAVPISFIKLLIEYSEYASGSSIFCMVLVIFASIGIALICCLLWFKRAGTLNTDATKGARFIAIPIMANFIQTIGEWSGIWIGIGGFTTMLFIMIFGSHELEYIFSMKAGFVGLIACLIIGYLTVVVFRFIAELNLAMASIANNAKSIDKEVKNISAGK